MNNKKELKTEIKCSFCSKDRKEVGALIKGNDVCICDECISISVYLMSTELHEQAKEISKLNRTLGQEKLHEIS